MKNLLIIALILLSSVGMAQTAKVVTTNGGADDVYFSFSNNEVQRINRATWDIGFTTKGFDASILINENAGVELFLYGNNIAAWDQVDTTGFVWNNRYNSEESWTLGAFANQGTSHPDYGWGTYTQTNHDINGDRIFIIKLSDKNYKQIMVEKMSAAGVYTVKLADLGGANTNSFSLNKKDAAYTSKNFVLYSLVSNEVVNEEPNNDSWDLLFTKYITIVQQGPVTQPYLVSGVKVNAGYEVAERTGFPTSSNDTSMLVWDTKITEIGSDWKTFNSSTFQYDITSDLTYFVRTQKGEVWKIFFTDYKGGTEGGFYFNIERVSGSASVGQYSALNSRVYPNPAVNNITVESQENTNLIGSLIDMQGRRVRSLELLPFETNTIETRDLARGIYTLVLRGENGMSSKKVILE